MSFLDVGLRTELKNWIRCRRDWRQYEHNAHKLAWERFYNQTRAYLKNLQKLKVTELLTHKSK